MADPLRIYTVTLSPDHAMKMTFSQRAMRLAKQRFAKIFGAPISVARLVENFDADICYEFASAASIVVGQTFTPDRIGALIDDNPENYAALARAVLEGIGEQWQRMTPPEERTKKPEPPTMTTPPAVTPGTSTPVTSNDPTGGPT